MRAWKYRLELKWQSSFLPYTWEIRNDDDPAWVQRSSASYALRDTASREGEEALERMRAMGDVKQEHAGQ